MTQEQEQKSLELLGDLLRFQQSETPDGKTRDKILERSQELGIKYPYAKSNWGDAERIAWLIAVLPHVTPNALDRLLRENVSEAGDFPHLGGAKGQQYRGIIPTGETVLFLLGGFNTQWRREARTLFAADHFFAEKRLLQLDRVPAGEPAMSGKLLPDRDVLEKWLTGREAKPHFSTTFPAERLSTKLDWEDLVLNARTRQQLEEIMAWIDYGNILYEDWGLGKRIKPGYRALFHGPPGTGKTLTAALIGKRSGRDVYRVDLSMVVSKYIGETEKNLANLFAKAEHKGWILFFDEADALFGKRTNVKDAHDKYANQEVSYLLQRVESYNGLVILASNFKSNIDEAFMRRFQAVIAFQLPNHGERLQLWRAAWPEVVKANDYLDLPGLSRQYEISGAIINNVVQKVCLHLLANGNPKITQKMVLSALRYEMGKEGKLI